MKKILLTAFIAAIYFTAQAQVITDTTNTMIRQQVNQPSTPANWKKIDLSNRSNDHLMIQYGVDGWGGVPDSAKPGGFSRHFNMYIMLDKPFKTNPHFSVGIGAGVGSSNMFFKSKNVDIKSTGTKLPFQKLDSLNHFKKYKLTTAYLEAPVELRFSSNPGNDSKSFKAALGVKVGTLINVHTKGKTLVDKSGNTLNSYTAKESSKKFFNGTRLALTGRVGYGIISLYGAYQVTALLKDGVGPIIHPYSIGIAISGL